MVSKILVPDIGDFEKVEIIEILVKTGDEIKKNDSIVTLESDKSSVEVPSTEDGRVESINVKIGDKVSKGDVLISLSGVSVKNEDEKIKLEKVIIYNNQKYKMRIIGLLYMIIVILIH